MVYSDNIEIDAQAIKKDGIRLTNQLWKLIPMRENDENWEGHLDSLILEFNGLNRIYSSETKYLILISKLQGLYDKEVRFSLYRKTVFEAISLVREIMVKPYENTIS